MNNKYNGFLNRDQIKYIAIICMTFNHIAHAFFQEGSPLYEAFCDIGYFTAVTMCFSMVEGYYYTRSKKKYMERLLIFAVISEVPYFLFRPDGYVVLDVIFNLALCFGIVWVFENVKSVAKRNLIIVAIIIVSNFCDWAFLLPLITILFYKVISKYRRLEEEESNATPNNLFRDEKLSSKFRLDVFKAFMIAAVAYGFLYGIGCESNKVMLGLFAGLGIAVAGVFTAFFYNGLKSNKCKKLNKYFFYVYYPVHLLILYLLKTFVI